MSHRRCGEGQNVEISSHLVDHPTYLVTVPRRYDLENVSPTPAGSQAVSVLECVRLAVGVECIHDTFFAPRPIHHDVGDRDGIVAYVKLQRRTPERRVR